MKVVAALGVPVMLLGASVLTAASAGALPSDTSEGCRGQDGAVGTCDATPPPRPPAEVTSLSSTELDCETEVQVTTTTTITTEYVYDARTNSWVRGEPVTQTTTSESPVTPGCDDSEVLGAQASAHQQRKPPAASRAPAGVPATVDAGLAPTVRAGVPATAALDGPTGPRSGVLALVTLGGLLVGSGALTQASVRRRK